MEHIKTDKVGRILRIYDKLQKGERLSKIRLAEEYKVDQKSIQRDIDDIRAFLEVSDSSADCTNTIRYDRGENLYYIEQADQTRLTNSEILAVCKILLESRAFTKEEMDAILQKLVEGCAPMESYQLVEELIQNEAFHYVEPRHKRVFLDKLWEIGQAIQQCRYIEIEYRRTKDMSTVSRRLKPAAIMFSEYYFYLTAFIDNEEVRKDFDVLNDSFPTIYRIDRIEKLTVLEEKFYIPYKDRFEEGEFRKRIQFMYGGRLRRLKFRYSGTALESVLDRLPTAKVIEERDGAWIISAEVFGDGIDIWLRSQGDKVEVLE